MSPGKRKEMTWRRPSGSAMDDMAQPLQTIGTNSDHSFGCRMRRRAGMVCTVLAIGRFARPPSGSFDMPPQRRLWAGHKVQAVSQDTAHIAVDIVGSGILKGPDPAITSAATCPAK